MGDVLNTLGPGNKSSRTFIGATLVLPLESGDAVINLGLLVVEIMLLGIDDYHGMADGPGQLVGTGALQGHVCNKIGHLTHLGLSIRHPLHSLVPGICPLGLEALETLEWSG